MLIKFLVAVKQLFTNNDMLDGGWCIDITVKQQRRIQYTIWFNMIVQ